MYEPIPCDSLYRLDEHSIHPELQPLVNLVPVEELNMMIYDQQGPALVDTVLTIFLGQHLLLGHK